MRTFLFLALSLFLAFQVEAQTDLKFTLMDQDGNVIDQDEFLKLNKKKVIYIDAWAGWCGPCIREMPHLARLKDSLTRKEKKQIAFVYVSFDRSQKGMEGSIAKYDLDKKGNQHYWGAAKGTSFANYFRIRGIPRYIIIDKDGNVVHTNAHRPSHRNALSQLRSVLD